MPLPKVEMTVFETILARRSVRRYKARKVDRTTINILLEAAVRAPTAVHQEPWAFVIIQDTSLLHSLSNQAKPLFIAEVQEQGLERAGHSFDIFSHENFNVFYDASTLILICGKTAAPLHTADCWLAAENLMLAACAMGLGTCVIGSALSALNTAETKLSLNIPEKFSVVAPIVVGYPDDEIIHALRKNPVILANIPAFHSV
ncbi:MAG: nitroreductase family protein [Pseudomonadota bacterium]